MAERQGAEAKKWNKLMVLNRNRHAASTTTNTTKTSTAAAAIKWKERKKNDEQWRNGNWVCLCNEINIRFSSKDDDDMGGVWTHRAHSTRAQCDGNNETKIEEREYSTRTIRRNKIAKINPKCLKPTQLGRQITFLWQTNNGCTRQTLSFAHTQHPYTHLCRFTFNGM